MFSWIAWYLSAYAGQMTRQGGNAIPWLWMASIQCPPGGGADDDDDDGGDGLLLLPAAVAAAALFDRGYFATLDVEEEVKEIMNRVSAGFETPPWRWNVLDLLAVLPVLLHCQMGGEK